MQLRAVISVKIFIIVWNVIPLELPPLEIRKEDIPQLAGHFLEHFGKSAGTRKKGIQESVLNALVDYSWPGNVRELRNLIECIVSLTDNGQITLSDLPEYISGAQKPRSSQYSKLNGLPFMEAKKEVLQDFEKEYCYNLLKKCQGNISKAAQLAAVSRRTLYRIICPHSLHRSF